MTLFNRELVFARNYQHDFSENLYVNNTSVSCAVFSMADNRVVKREEEIFRIGLGKIPNRVVAQYGREPFVLSLAKGPVNGSTGSPRTEGVQDTLRYWATTLMLETDTVLSGRVI
jgi:hypothetical protein